MVTDYSKSSAQSAEDRDGHRPQHRWLMRATLGVVVAMLNVGAVAAQSMDGDRQRLVGKIISIESPIGMVKVPYGYILMRSNDSLLDVEGTVKFDRLQLGFNMPGATMLPYGMLDERYVHPELPGFSVRLINVQMRGTNPYPLSQEIADALRASNSRPGFPFTFENYRETIRITNPHTPGQIFYFLAGWYDPDFPGGKNPHAYLPTSAWIDFDARLSCPRQVSDHPRSWEPCLGRVDLPRMKLTFTLAMHARGADKFDDVVRASIKLLREIMTAAPG